MLRRRLEPRRNQTCQRWQRLYLQVLFLFRPCGQGLRLQVPKKPSTTLFLLNLPSISLGNTASGTCVSRTKVMEGSYLEITSCLAVCFRSDTRASRGGGRGTRESQGEHSPGCLGPSRLGSDHGIPLARRCTAEFPACPSRVNVSACCVPIRGLFPKGANPA